MKELEMKEPLIEIPIDLQVETTMELLLFSLAKRFSLSLRSPDVYDPFQIILWETGSQEIGVLYAC